MTNKVDAVAAVLRGHEFYRDGTRLLLRVAAIETAVLAALIVALFGLSQTREEPDYYATRPDGEIVELTPYLIEEGG